MEHITISKTFALNLIFCIRRREMISDMFTTIHRRFHFASVFVANCALVLLNSNKTLQASQREGFYAFVADLGTADELRKDSFENRYIKKTDFLILVNLDRWYNKKATKAQHVQKSTAY